MYKSCVYVLLYHSSKVTSFRCHETMVVAEVESKETVYWGVLNDNTEVKSPKCVPSGKHPRDMFGLTSHPATGGVVYIGRSWASCKIRNIAGAHGQGMPGTLCPPPRFSYPDMHHGTCVTRLALKLVTEKAFPAFPVHAQPAILLVWLEAPELYSITG